MSKTTVSSKTGFVSRSGRLPAPNAGESTTAKDATRLRVDAGGVKYHRERALPRNGIASDWYCSAEYLLIRSLWMIRDSVGGIVYGRNLSPESAYDEGGAPTWETRGLLSYY